MTAGSGVTCERWRDAISAGLDGEDPGIEPRLVDAHRRRCPACRLFAESASVGVAPSLSRGERDLPRRVARLAAAADRAATWSVGRGLLAAVALQILVFSVPALVMGDEQDTSTHAARHLGAFTVAYAAGLLVVVVRPARARTMLPVAAVLAGALLVTAVIDLANGRIPLVDEARHLPEVLSVVLVWLIAVPSPRWRPGAMRSVSRRTDDELAGPGLSSALPVVPDDRRAG